MASVLTDPLQPASSGVLTARALRVLADLVHTYSGIVLGPDKQMLVSNRLRRRVTELGLASYDAYIDRLTSPAGGEEIETLIDLITTNHTGFFREPEHFRFLSEAVIGTEGSVAGAARGPLRIWSAAVASGEEAYTIAMVAAEAGRRGPGPGVEILGSDISRRMVAVADRATYGIDAVAAIPVELRRRYFQRGVRTQQGQCRVQPALRAAVELRRINLLDSAYPLSGLQHVIFCRNVMIYFDAELRSEIVDRLVRHLLPGGYLFVGYSESLNAAAHGLEAVRHGVYRRS